MVDAWLPGWCVHRWQTMCAIEQLRESTAVLDLHIGRSRWAHIKWSSMCVYNLYTRTTLLLVTFYSSKCRFYIPFPSVVWFSFPFFFFMKELINWWWCSCTTSFSLRTGKELFWSRFFSVPSPSRSLLSANEDKITLQTKEKTLAMAGNGKRSHFLEGVSIVSMFIDRHLMKKMFGFDRIPTRPWSLVK